jgi:hypothetical protein
MEIDRDGNLFTSTDWYRLNDCPRLCLLFSPADWGGKQGIVKTNRQGETSQFVGGVSPSAERSSPIESIALDGSGNLYSLETLGNSLVGVSLVLTKTSPDRSSTSIPIDEGLAGDGSERYPDSFEPEMVVRPDGTSYVSAPAGVIKIESDGTQTLIRSALLKGEMLIGDRAIALGGDGSLFIAVSAPKIEDPYLSVERIDQAGRTYDVGPGPKALNDPPVIASDSVGNLFILGRSGSSNCFTIGCKPTIVKIAHGGKRSTTKLPNRGEDWQLAVSNDLGSMTTDPRGNLYVLDRNLSNVTKLTPGGKISVPGAVPLGTYNIAVDGSGNIFAAVWTRRANVSIAKIASGVGPARPRVSVTYRRSDPVNRHLGIVRAVVAPSPGASYVMTVGPSTYAVPWTHNPKGKSSISARCKPQEGSRMLRCKSGSFGASHSAAVQVTPIRAGVTGTPFIKIVRLR